MRTFTPLHPPADFDARLVKILNNLNGYLHQVDQGFGAIQRGASPAGGGGGDLPITALADHHKLSNLTKYDDHPQYAYLPGRSAGQTLYGTNPSTSPNAWTDAGNFTSQDSKVAASTWSSVAIDVSAAVGDTVVLILSTLPFGTGLDGVTSNHSTITDTKGNTWTKLRERSYSDAFLNGCCVSVWYCTVTTALAAGSDTLSFAYTGSIGAMAVSSHRYRVGSGMLVVAGITELGELVTSAGPSALSLSGLTSGVQYLFLRANGVGQAGSTVIGSFTKSVGYTSFVHTNSITSGGTGNVAACGEYTIGAATAGATDPQFSGTSIYCMSIYVALAVVPVASGSLTLASQDSYLAAKLALIDSNAYLSGNFIYFRAAGGTTNLSYIRATDGAFVGPLTSTSLHSSLGGLTTGDDHTQYLLLAGRTGGQQIGSGSITGGTTTDLAIIGRLLVGTTLHNYTTGRALDVTGPMANSQSVAFMLGDATGFSGVASGISSTNRVSDTGLAGYSSGTFSNYTLWILPQLTVPAGVTVLSKAIRGQNQTSVPATNPGLIFSMVGCQGDVVGPANAMSGAGTNMAALVGSIQVGSNNTWTNLYGLLIENAGGTGTDTISNSYGIRVFNNWLVSTCTVSGNHHGLYIDARTGGATISGTDYGIRILGTSAKNVIAGQLRVGSDAVATHLLELAAGTTTIAPFKFTAGTNLTAAVAGCMEFDGTNLFITNSTPTRKTLAQLETAQTWSASQTYSANPGIILNNAVGIRAKDSGGTTRSIIDPLATDIVRFAPLGNSGWTFTNTGGTVGITVLPTGRIFIGGTTSPTHLLDLAAGTTTAAPIKLTSATAITTPVAGCIEFTTDDFFATITTGTARKAFILDDGTRLTSGRVPFATTNGRLIDDADFTFSVDTLTITKIAATTLTGDLTFANAINIVVNTSTGTKFGTATNQKIAFWNAAPIVQPTTGVAAATFVANTSGIVNDTATWDGYTIGQVVKALRNMGLLA